MSKPPRRKRSRPRPPLPPIGSYVLLFQAPDATLHDPPIPLDQRLTDDELKEVVHAVHAKLKARGATNEPADASINHADELPGGIRLEDQPSSNPLKETDKSDVDDKTVVDMEAGLLRAGACITADDRTDLEKYEEYRKEFFNADGSPKHPVGAAPAIKTVASDESWSKALLAVGLQGFCIVAGSLLAGACMIVGGWAAIKFLSST